MKKYQSSLEFATTYAWALVIILVVIVSLIFYSEAESNTGLEIECRLGPQFECQDAIIDSYGQFDMHFVNNINDEVIISSVNFKEKLGDCPALPLVVGKGRVGNIQCVFEDALHSDDTENFIFDVNFTTNKSNTSFISKGRITTRVVEEIDSYELKCDFDGDSYDKYGCGNDNDCDDKDPSKFFSACRVDADCGDPINYDCVNEGRCDAECVELLNCDEDEDGDISSVALCGGPDQCDNIPGLSEPVCAVEADCPSGIGIICLNPGSCTDSECFDCDVDNDYVPGVYPGCITGAVFDCNDNDYNIRAPECGPGIAACPKDFHCVKPGTCAANCESDVDIGSSSGFPTGGGK